jgi:hypothetical protein
VLVVVFIVFDNDDALAQQKMTPYFFYQPGKEIRKEACLFCINEALGQIKLKINFIQFKTI